MNFAQRFFFLILGLSMLVSLNAYANEPFYPSAPVGYVNDYANLIAPEHLKTINNLLEELNQKTTAQAAVLTTDTTYPDTIEQYAVKIFKMWGIGQKDKDNGVLFVVAIKDRAVRIETGYGLEGALTDLITSRIIQQIALPQFKNGNYSEGITESVKAIVSLIAKEYNVAVIGMENQAYETIANNNHEISGISGFILWFIIIMIIFFLISRSNRYGGGYWYGGGGYSGGSGGFGGGFGGFGGGSSGGGGASGRW